jgi:hypothetical protein
VKINWRAVNRQVENLLIVVGLIAIALSALKALQLIFG